MNETTAAQVMQGFLNSVGTAAPEVSASFFAENGTLELPYAGKIGLPESFTGHKTITSVISNMLTSTKSFKMKNLKVVMEQGDMVAVEYESEAVMNNGHTYDQLYMGYATVKNGKIIKYREVMDTVTFARAFFPNGAADLPVNNQ